MPVLPDLATPADLTAYGYAAVGAGKLARASARVRGFTHQQITEGSSTVTLTGCSPWLLPQRPVTEVTSVVDEAGLDVEYTLTGAWLSSCACPPLTVEYEHGYAVLPDPLVELVCAIASRLDTAPTQAAAGVRTEQAGGESITWGAEAFERASGLTKAEEAALLALFPKYPRSWPLL